MPRRESSSVMSDIYSPYKSTLRQSMSDETIKRSGQVWVRLCKSSVRAVPVSCVNMRTASPLGDSAHSYFPARTKHSEPSVESVMIRECSQMNVILLNFRCCVVGKGVVAFCTCSVVAGRDGAALPVAKLICKRVETVKLNRTEQMREVN